MAEGPAVPQNRGQSICIGISVGYAGMHADDDEPSGLADAAGTQARRKRPPDGHHSIVEQALRELLARDEGVPEKDDLLPTYRAPGSHPLVDIDDRDTLYAALDAERPG